jgi:hypothetical protein
VKRKATFSSNKGTVACTIGESIEDCESFLISECMSEEEDDEFYNNSLIVSSFRILTPSWRSDKVVQYNKKKSIYTNILNKKLNKMFNLLDEIYLENSRHLTEFKRRVHTRVVSEAPIVSERNKLPVWGTQDVSL